jgi:serine/threonine protein kinase/Tfp pilus assembly protein PilF
MKAERWREIENLFHAATERDSRERAAFLDHACAGDDDLRREVETLLDQSERGCDLLETTAADLASEWVKEQQRITVKQTVGHFRILSPLGKGGMGEVYLAEDSRLRRKVALKLLPKVFADQEERRRRFEQEARAASALNHPNIVTIYDIGQASSEEGGAHFIAAEFVEGQTLRALMKRERMGLAAALDTAAQVSSALEAAHAAGIVHRDIKPENIMVRNDGLVKVVDFGLAKLIGGNGEWGVENGEWGKDATSVSPHPTLYSPPPSLSIPGIVMGTLAYMSPEQARGLEVDARTDIFSLGVVFYEMITGRAPFEGGTTSDLIAAILTSYPVPLGDCAPGTPTELERIVGRALQKDCEKRYQTIRDLNQDLKLARQELEPGAPRIALRANSLPHVIRRRKAIFAVLALTLLALTGIGVYLQLGRSDAVDSIAILPFVNEGADPNVEYLSDELPVSLINSLSRLRRLRVMPRSSVFRYKGQQLDPAELGRKLGVRVMLTGKVAQRNDRLNIQVELVDVERVAIIWGDTFDRPLTDILRIQDEIAAKIVDELNLKLSGAEQTQVARRHTKEPEAWLLYVRGRHLAQKGGRDSQWKAVKYFKQAIARDAGFALAYAELSFAYMYLEAAGNISGNEAARWAKEYVMKALAIDSELAEARVYLGDIKYIYEWDWKGAEDEFQRALALNPTSAIANRSYGIYLVCLKRYDEAIAHMKRALGLESLSSLFNHELGAIYYFAGQFDQTIEQNLNAIELEANNEPAYYYLGKAYAQKRLYDQAFDIILKKMSDPDIAKMYKKTYDSAGWKGVVRKRLARKLNLIKQQYISPFSIAEDYMYLGEREQALKWLEKAVDDRDDYLTFLGVEPVLAPLHDDPRFKRLMRCVGLER